VEEELLDRFELCVGVDRNRIGAVRKKGRKEKKEKKKKKKEEEGRRSGREEREGEAG
jgi:hypothetical protein